MSLQTLRGAGCPELRSVVPVMSNFRVCVLYCCAVVYVVYVVFCVELCVVCCVLCCYVVLGCCVVVWYVCAV